MDKSSTSKNGEGKSEENLVAHDVVDKCKISKKNQAQQSACRQCAASMPNKCHEAVGMR